jgi:hypothetical protein
MIFRLLTTFSIAALLSSAAIAGAELPHASGALRFASGGISSTAGSAGRELLALELNVGGESAVVDLWKSSVFPQRLPVVSFASDASPISRNVGLASYHGRSGGSLEAQVLVHVIDDEIVGTVESGSILYRMSSAPNKGQRSSDETWLVRLDPVVDSAEKASDHLPILCGNTGEPISAIDAAPSSSGIQAERVTTELKSIEVLLVGTGQYKKSFDGSELGFGALGNMADVIIQVDAIMRRDLGATLERP